MALPPTYDFLRVSYTTSLANIEKGLSRLENFANRWRSNILAASPAAAGRASVLDCAPSMRRALSPWPVDVRAYHAADMHAPRNRGGLFVRSKIAERFSRAARSCLRLTASFGVLSSVWCPVLLQAAAQVREQPVTFNRDIAPIVFKQCSPCHRPGQSGPFSLLTYAEAAKHAKEIADVTAKHTMPPWLLEPGYGEFKEERRLTGDEIQLLKKWLTDGAVEGNAADLPPAPKWSEGWQLGEPDLILKIPEAFTLPEAGRDVWRTFVIPAPLPATRFVRAMEFRPGNKAVHHAAMRLDRTPQARLRDASDPGPGFGGITPPDTARPPAGHVLNWLPGRTAYKSPEGMTWPFEKGADFLVQLHMQTSGRAETIQPTVGFYFTDRPPTNHLFVFPLMVRTIDIPAGATNYHVHDSYKLPVDVRVFWINPHAHYLAKEMKGYARLPDGTQKWLFVIKNWDFNWQGDYSYREPLALPKGTEIFMDYSFDNSDANPHNPTKPARRVQFGQQSTDEMAELWIQVLTRDRKELAMLERDFQGKLLAEMTAYYTYCLRLNPGDAHAECRLGFTKLSLGQRAEAIAHLQRAVELDPHADEPHLHLGMIRLQQERYELAQAELEAALRNNPNNYLAEGNLGLLHMNQGHLLEAEAHLRATLRLNPLDQTAQENLQTVLNAIESVRRQSK
ncbi:MAG: tetratricopeptide repeat protein [Verrucomicrobia bacterium]|nr:tetratricopeptide repeat protein [Verrucomicrobiota bacterium]